MKLFLPLLMVWLSINGDLFRAPNDFSADIGDMIHYVYTSQCTPNAYVCGKCNLDEINNLYVVESVEYPDKSTSAEKIYFIIPLKDKLK